MIQIGFHGVGSPNSGIIDAAEPPLPGFAAFTFGCPDTSLGGCGNTSPEVLAQTGFATSQLTYYPDIAAWGANSLVAGKSGTIGTGKVLAGTMSMGSFNDYPGGPGSIKFYGSGTTVLNQLALCDHYASKFQISVGNCYNGVKLSTSDGELDAGVLRADASSSLANISVGLAPPIRVPTAAYTGTAGSTNRQYAFTVVSPLGVEGGIIGDAYAVNSTLATLDGSDYVTITCPTSLQQNYPTGTTYKVWQILGTNYPLGTCPINGTVVDNVAVASGTLPTTSANSYAEATQWQVGLGGSYSFWNSNTTGRAQDTFINRISAGKVGIGTTTGTAHDGSFEAANGIFDTTLAAHGSLVCTADGTNCPAGGGGISGLTTGYIPKATSATAIGNSLLDDGITTANTLTYAGTGGISANSFTSTDTTHNTNFTGKQAAGGSDVLPTQASGSSYITYLAATGFNEADGTGAFSPLTRAVDFAAGTGMSVSVTGKTVTYSATGASGIANTTITVGTTAIAANTCTTAATATMTGVATTSVFDFTPNADVSGVTGWGTTGGLTIVPWPTLNTLNYKVCNQTAASITPSASVVFNVGAR
jgi:hypothetical protein